MFHRIKHPWSFWLLIVFLIVAATGMTPHLWSVPLMMILVGLGWALRAVSHREARW